MAGGAVEQKEQRLEGDEEQQEIAGREESEAETLPRVWWIPTKSLVKLLSCMGVTLAVYMCTGWVEWRLRMALVLLVLAASLWVTEALPLAATSLLIALLQPLFGIQSFREALTPFFDPVVVLLLGGFLLALAVDKHDLDEVLGREILRRLGRRPRRVTLGMMAATALLSMWISNTAATALMMTVALPLADRAADPRGNMAKVVVLGVAYSATLGGLMTLIGSPPNALAAAFLGELTGQYMSFLQWSLYGLPLALLLVVVAWVLLFWRFPPGVEGLPPVEAFSGGMKGPQKATFIVFLVAVVLWLTDSFHPLSASMVAVAVAVILFAVGLLRKGDLGRVDWNTLLLFGGGLSLGAALESSGLALVITGGVLTLVPLVSYWGVVALMGMATMLFSMVASNTASASIFIPIGVNVALGMGGSPVVFAVLVATSSSLDFMLPIGTPPNAIAYSTGRVSMREMIVTGATLNLIGLLFALLLALYVWPWIPIL